ncbi:hypothetical protein DdX_11257 [Ditylenchus destructor]|uniref:F-box domain-containing protein n=1 Tax=Ditylenchus destructor TaxID=166010 RepID=A0AAD4N0G2_9BILA|nr:hypothetical protein DdX_11257 [Ditylenchus destructor]
MANQLLSALDRISRISHELQQASNMLLTAVNNGQVGQSMAAKLEIARRQCLDVLEENNYGKVGRSDIQRPITMNNLDDELLAQIFSHLSTLANVMQSRAICRRWHRVIDSGIDNGQFYCCRVVSKETVGRAMGLLDLLQVLHRLRKHLQKLELETLAVLNHDNPYLWDPFRALFSDMPPSRELLNKFLRHFSFLEELHLCGFQDWQLLKVQYVGALEWPPNLRVLKIEDGIDVGFGPNHWRFAGNVFANLALRCSELRELRIVVSPTDFVLMDLVKLFRSLESLDVIFEPIHSFVNREPNCEIFGASEIIAPNLRLLRMNTEPKVTLAILSVLSDIAPRLTDIELFGSVDQALLQPLTHFPALECLTLSRLDNSVTDDDLCPIFAANYQLKQLKRLDIFELEKVSMTTPGDLLNSVSASLEAREHNPVPLELHTDVQLAEKLTNALMPPGLSVSVLELSKHRYVFLKYIYRKIYNLCPYLPPIKNNDDVYDYYPCDTSEEDDFIA